MDKVSVCPNKMHKIPLIHPATWVYICNQMLFHPNTDLIIQIIWGGGGGGNWSCSRNSDVGTYCCNFDQSCGWSSCVVYRCLYTCLPVPNCVDVSKQHKEYWTLLTWINGCISDIPSISEVYLVYIRSPNCTIYPAVSCITLTYVLFM